MASQPAAAVLLNLCIVCLAVTMAVSAPYVRPHDPLSQYGHSILHTPHVRNYSTCPRHESRWARDLVKEYVFTHLGRNGARDLLPSCPLRPDIDVFHVEEKNRIFKRHGLWQCGFCKKKFKNGDFLDKHFVRKHANMTPSTADVCLADLCDSLHCPWFHSRQYRKHEGGTASLAAHCLPAAASRAANDCEGLADACFDPSRGPAWASMHTYFTKHFCGSLTCDHKAREALLLAAVRTTSRKGTLMVLGIVLVVLMVLFYAGLYVYWSINKATQKRGPAAAVAGRGGLQKLRGRVGIAPSWLPSPPKPKNY